MTLVLTVSALVVITSFILEASVQAPLYAYCFSAVGAVLVVIAVILALRGRSRK